MKLVIVAVRALWPIPDVVAKLATLMVNLPAGTEVWVRGVSPVERAATILADELGFPTIWLPPRDGPSRDTVFVRDYDLVKEADLVVGFFLEGSPDPLGGGTGHVIHAAIQKGVPCEAWCWTSDGLINVGSDDGDDGYRVFPHLDGHHTYDQMAGSDVGGMAG